MAAMCRTTKTLLFSAKTIVPLYQRSSNSLIHIYAPKGQKASPKSPLPSSIRKEFKKIAKNERQRLEEVLKSKGMQEGSYPQFTVAVTKQKVTDKFQIPPTYYIPPLVANLMSDFGVKVEGSCGTDSEVLWQLILSCPNEEKDVNGIQRQLNDKTGNGEDLHIFMSRSLNCNDGPEIKFIKQGSFSSSKLDALVSLLQLEGENRVSGRAKGDLLKNISIKKSVASLEAMGVKVYGLDKPNLDFTKSEISWDNIAGYNQQKRNIEDAVLLALRRPEVYDDIARGTRCKFETNRPRALLFDGPPGTGKTSCARVIANQAGVPLLYVPLEVYMSKWVGESEKLFAKVFSLANEIPDGAIIFLDEIDSLATSRSNRMRECTRRILSILLQQLDGFEQDKKVIVIGATNRKEDLDPALSSRFNSVITFGLPDKEIRKNIAAQYAKHLTNKELAEFAEATEGMAGRDIKNACQKAEWRWASKIIRGQEQRNSEHLALPPIDEYIESVGHGQGSVASLEAMGVKVYGLDKPNLDFTKSEISWNNIAGYNQQKRNIEDAVLLALRRPEVYDDIVRGTRCKFETNRPRALLFDGPPGTGKTSCARVIANQAGVPLLYVPLEIVKSKWYGESERLLAKVFSLANDLPNGAIIFLDEIDGYEQDKKVIVIGATNRKEDLDPALSSRFNSVITFGLPDKEIRKNIAAQYAKHLTEEELAEFAEATEGMAGRDIKNACQKAEWRWASKIIRGQEQRNSEHLALPPIDEYIESVGHGQGSVASLEAMGVKVYGLDKPNLDFTKSEISWNNIAGYNQQKRNIEDAVLLALRRPEVYDDIVRGTRCKFETNRPRALLFDGPPGTGKTSCARVIANQAGVPLLYVPLEIVKSKWYGESERLLAKVFSLANDLPNGAIIFLDEIDSLATSRNGHMHEATRRILSVLLRQIDGYEQDKKVIVIGATNRKEDLDPALSSRFNSVITFGLPDKEIRKDIAAQYAKHLTEEELAEFAEATEGMAGRDIKYVCQDAECRWASKIIRGQEQKNSEPLAFPPIDEYIESAEHRRESRHSDVAEERR